MDTNFGGATSAAATGALEGDTGKTLAAEATSVEQISADSAGTHDFEEAAGAPQLSSAASPLTGRMREVWRATC